MKYTHTPSSDEFESEKEMEVEPKMLRRAEMVGEGTDFGTTSAREKVPLDRK